MEHTGKWLRDARKAAGLSYAEAAYQLRDHMPRPYWVSLDTIRRAEQRAAPDPILAAGLARVYGVTDLPEHLAEQMAQLQLVLAESPPSSACVTADRGAFVAA